MVDKTSMNSEIMSNYTKFSRRYSPVIKIMIPDPILIQSEYLIILSRFNFEAKIPMINKVKENPAANNAVLAILYSKLPVEAL